MKTPRTQIARVVAKQTLAHRFTHTDIQSLAAYLLQEGRTGELGSLLRDVQADWANRGHVEVIATSAHELSATAVREVKAEARKLFPNAKQISVTQKLDPTVVGGVQLQIVDYRLDLSVMGELQKFKMLAVQGKDQVR